MVKTSVLMTVHDRDPEVLLATLRSVNRCFNEMSQASDCELIVVNDRSEMDYSWIKDYTKPRFNEVKWVNTGDYDGFRVDGYGNPAHAFNVGLDVATGDRLVVMSSDVIVTPKAVWSMDRFWSPEYLYTPRVINMDTFLEYCGATRPFPMPWFLVMPTKLAQDLGGWDEEFLGGLCYEDNDFVARLALNTTAIRCDWDAVVYHQSHVQPAYDVKSDEILAANARNRDICKRKWNGIPFDGEQACWTMKTKPDPAGCTRLEINAPDLKERFGLVKA